MVKNQIKIMLLGLSIVLPAQAMFRRASGALNNIRLAAMKNRYFNSHERSFITNRSYEPTFDEKTDKVFDWRGKEIPKPKNYDRYRNNGIIRFWHAATLPLKGKFQKFANPGLQPDKLYVTQWVPRRTECLQFAKRIDDDYGIEWYSSPLAYEKERAIFRAKTKVFDALRNPHDLEIRPFYRSSYLD